jgi:hypothetical protein
MHHAFSYLLALAGLFLSWRSEVEYDLRAVLRDCWLADDDPESTGYCRWCRFEREGEHALNCPCRALSSALDQRDALAEYIRAEKHYLRVQGSFRLARKSGRPEAKERMDEARYRLENALAKLQALGIEALAS